jgi:hypothetical protein
LVSVVLPVEVPPATRILARAATPARRALGLRRAHDPGGDVIGQREDRDGGLADRETGRGDDGRQKPLEALARAGQFGRDPGPPAWTSAPT